MKINSLKSAILLVTLATIGWAAPGVAGDDWKAKCGTGSGNVKDEAMCAGRTADSLPGSDEDYYRDMDYGATKNPEALAQTLAPYLPGITPQEAVKAAAIGRNNWIVWTAGNDRMWDVLNKKSFGELDFLKTISNHPGLKFSRSNRWNYLGLVNEPCFSKPTAPRKDRFGLWLDMRDPSCAPDPFENEAKYPGVKIGARGRSDNFPVGSYYGYATGIVGLRLFPNPDFDEEAEKNWDPERFYNDPSYYNNKNLVRPYRVGMSCGFCHVGPNPTNPPADPENPKWENLNSNPGAQYFWWDRIFTYTADPTNFAYQYFHTSRPGALDTSLISTDYIINPRTMNAIYNLGPRLQNALKLGHEKLVGGEQDNKQFNEYVPPGTPLTKFFSKPDQVWTPRVLKDGSDSAGALASFNRVYVNIGLFSEEWFEHFNPIVGGKPISPIEIKIGRANSSYWQANEKQTPNTALFFVATAKPDYLKNAPNGAANLAADAATMAHGKEVFGERCARCHSSKLPEKTYSFFPNDGCVGKDYLTCWNAYWDWTKSDEAKLAFKKIVTADDFLVDNFLSTDLRVPVSLLETNACSPLATNAIKDNIWNDYSSTSYKDLPSVGTITVHHPFTGEPRPYEMPAGGRGYTRPASLISLWSTAPFLLNNSVGEFNPSPSVEARLASFNSSIEQMLWPEKRTGNIDYVTASGKKLRGQVDVTTAPSYLRVPKGYLPDFLQAGFNNSEKLQPLVEALRLGHFFDEDGVALGPIPKGTPVALLGNIDLDKRDNPIDEIKHIAQLGKVLLKLKFDLKALPSDASDDDARRVFSNVLDDLLAVNKCPDFVVNRGHYFGTDYFKEEPSLSDDDKRALIAFLKTF
ncbi:hypothetical protein [Methylocapsa acidiphila]|uniref:Cytochrome c domain-containing protein n=1 Tax=Methylocapsa acidiphila TaxID=133552 RepID=Q2VNN5_METAI|nr:hypothetical protein [Methylocapsa acidiphila]CAJ01597.1 conserved hypothetical protein containing putative cytochrome c heme-binding site [Methylocapsa acidiphila]